MGKSKRLAFHRINDNTYYLSGATINPQTGKYTQVAQSTIMRRIVIPDASKSTTRVTSGKPDNAE